MHRLWWYSNTFVSDGVSWRERIICTATNKLCDIDSNIDSSISMCIWLAIIVGRVLTLVFLLLFCDAFGQFRTFIRVCVIPSRVWYLHVIRSDTCHDTCHVIHSNPFCDTFKDDSNRIMIDLIYQMGLHDTCHDTYHDISCEGIWYLSWHERSLSSISDCL